MLQSGKRTKFARRIFTFVLFSLLLVACGQEETSVTPTLQNVPAVTPNSTTSKLASTAPQTTQVTQTATTPKSTAPVYSGLAKGKLKEMYPVLAGLVDAKSFKINDDWSGLSTDSPRQNHFTISRKSGQFEGNGVYSIGGYNWVGNMNNSYFEASVAITIPLEVGQQFLQMLADALVVAGPAKTNNTTGVDNYPSLTMEIDTGYGTLKFNSLSSCCYVRTFFFAGQTFEGTDTSASDAFGLLEPYLHREVQKTLYKKSPSLKSTLSPTTTPGVTLTPTVK